MLSCSDLPSGGGGGERERQDYKYKTKTQTHRTKGKHETQKWGRTWMGFRMSCQLGLLCVVSFSESKSVRAQLLHVCFLNSLGFNWSHLSAHRATAGCPFPERCQRWRARQWDAPHARGRRNYKETLCRLHWTQTPQPFLFIKTNIFSTHF